MNPLDPALEAKVKRVFPEIDGASAYACFIRYWLEQDIDAVIWWQDSNGFFKRLIRNFTLRSGHRHLKRATTGIDDSAFLKVQEDFLRLGVCEISSQSTRIRYGNDDHCLGFKRTGQPAHWLEVLGGLHSDPRGNALLGYILEANPLLYPRLEDWR